MKTKIRIIKKYPNRRLYDTELGVYITLEDIKKLVIDQIDFQIIDARSKKDLTHSTLLQIISEQETMGTPLFTTELLQNFIRFYHEKSQNVFSQYLQQVMRLFIQQKEMFKNQWPNYPTFMDFTENNSQTTNKNRSKKSNFKRKSS